MFGLKGSPHTRVRTRDRTFLKRAIRPRDDGAAQDANVLRLLPRQIFRIHLRKVALKCIGTVLVVILSHQHRRHGLIRLRLGRRLRSFIAHRRSVRRYRCSHSLLWHILIFLAWMCGFDVEHGHKPHMRQRITHRGKEKKKLT